VRDDEGIALVIVIGISVVLLLLVTVALNASLSAVKTSKSDESWNGAIAAAYAGIEDYKSKLANDSGYYRYGNSSSQFTISSGSNVTAPSTTNPAFGTGVSGTWAVIPDGNAHDQDYAYYRYEVDNHAYVDSGTLRVRATGKVGDQTRSVVANLKQTGFIDFLYYTTYEITDPVLGGLTAAQQLSCTKYAYAGRPSSGCGALAFGAFDVINGPMHTNDTFRSCGSTFNGAVTTSYYPASGDAYVRGNATSAGCPTGTVEHFPKGKPASVSTLELPQTNKTMFNEVRTDIPLDTPRPGCLYTGPTKITFTADGKMTVRSPWTKVTRISNAAGTSGTTPTECGLPGIGTGQLGSAGGATVTVPARNLIYVQDVQFVSTAVSATQPQWQTNTYPKKPVSGTYSSTDCTNGNFLGYPIANEDIRTGISSAYNCKKGDVFVEGIVDGEVTINAENYIYVTNDLVYDSTAPNSVLGLVAQNQVWVWNPVHDWNGVTGTNAAATRFYSGDRKINAAMLSVNKTFQVQNYDVGGPRGSLIITGAIAQKFRGPVATGNTTTGALTTGFSKNYNYDERFKYTAPPKFLSPVSTTYGVSTIVESKTAYNPDGSKIN
jgi:hypothetical protein